MCLHQTTPTAIPEQLSAIAPSVIPDPNNPDTASSGHYNDVAITNNANPVATAIRAAGANPANVGVRTPGFGGRALELLTGGAYDPTQGADTATGAFAGGKETKWGVLARMMGLAEQGGIEGAFLGKSTPGGGFQAVQNLNLLRNQMLLRNLMLQNTLAKTQSDIQKNTAMTGFYNRGGNTRVGQPVPGANGNYWRTDPVTRELIDTGVRVPPKPENYELREGQAGPNGQPTYSLFNKNTGKITPALIDMTGGNSSGGLQAPAANPALDMERKNAESISELTGDAGIAKVPVMAQALGESTEALRPPVIDNSTGMQSPGAIRSTAASGVPFMPAVNRNPRAGRVATRNAAGTETDNLIDENPESQTFGRVLKRGVATRAPLPDRGDATRAQKDADSASAENYAGMALAQVGGDPNKAIAYLNGLKSADPKVQQQFNRLLPLIRQHIRDRVKGAGKIAPNNGVGISNEQWNNLAGQGGTAQPNENQPNY
jgi:hypothetical protein